MLAPEFNYIASQRTWVPHPKKERAEIWDIRDLNKAVPVRFLPEYEAYKFCAYDFSNSDEYGEAAQDITVVSLTRYKDFQSFVDGASRHSFDMFRYAIAEFLAAGEKSGGVRIVIDDRFNPVLIDGEPRFSFRILGGENLGQAPGLRWFEKPPEPDA